jgi:hypothetical protein
VCGIEPVPVPDAPGIEVLDGRGISPPLVLAADHVVARVAHRGIIGHRLRTGKANADTRVVAL